MIIVKGWIKCGILQAFDLDFQIEAMGFNATTPLFKKFAPQKSKPRLRNEARVSAI